MTTYDLPDNRFAEAEWELELVQAAAASPWTGAEGIEADPWRSRWKLSATHAPIVGEANILPWRALLRKMNGRANRFRFTAVEQAQHALANPKAAPGGVPAMVNTANVIVGTDSLQRTLASGTFNAGARSSSAYPTANGLALSFQPAQTNARFAIGFNDDAAAASSEADIDFAWYVREDGVLQAIENGSLSAQIGAAYTANERLGLTLEPQGSNVRARYWRGGDAVREVVTAAASSYYLDASFRDPGIIDDISFGPSGVGLRTLALTGLPVSTTLLAEGALMTVILDDGEEQLVSLTAPLAGDAGGRGTATFEPPLRRGPAPTKAVETAAPWAVLALDGPVPIRISPGQRYDFTLTASESVRRAAA